MNGLLGKRLFVLVLIQSNGKRNDAFVGDFFLQVLLTHIPQMDLTLGYRSNILVISRDFMDKLVHSFL
jgi:hypothetical protein